MKIRIRHQVFIAFLLAYSTFSTAFADDPWTSVGSAGVVDESDSNEHMFLRGTANIKSTAPASTTVVLRYNVVSTGDLNNGGIDKGMSVRFRDNGAFARVKLYLKSYNINSGVTRTLLSFDSNHVGSSGTYQKRFVNDGCSSNIRFDFRNHAYYVEAYLSRTNRQGKPSLGIIQIQDSDIC